MNDILKICGVTLCAAMLSLLVRSTKPELAALVGCGGAVVIVGCALTTFTPIAEYISRLVDMTEYGDTFGVMFRALGIALAASTTADFCRDMGETSLASKVELAAKCEILLLGLPLVESLLSICRTLAV